MNDSGDESQKSGSEDEPLVPDIIEEEFITNLFAIIPQILKILRQKTENQEHADNVQRIFICCNRFQSELQQEQIRSQELKNEIENCRLRVEEADEVSRINQASIEELRKVIEKAWKQKDSAQLREQIAKEEVTKLRNQVTQLEEEIQKLSEKRTGRHDKKDESKEKEKLKAEIAELNKKMQIQRLYVTEIEGLKQDLEEKNKALIRLVDETSTDVYSYKRDLDAVVKEVATLRSEESKLTEQVEQLTIKNEQLIKQKVQQNMQILAVKTNLEHLNTQHNAINNKLAKTIVDLEYVTTDRDRKKVELAQKTTLLKSREEELIKLRQENASVCKSQDAAARKYSIIMEAKKKAEEENIRMRSVITAQEKEIKGMQKVVEHLENINGSVTKERDILKRDLILSVRAADESEQKFNEAQHGIRSLKDSINLLELKQNKLQDELNKAANDKAKKLEEIQSLGDKIDALQNEIHLKENYEIELKRTISDTEAKCAQLQTKHDAIQNEKNNLQRAIQSGEDECNALKKHLEVANNSLKTLVNRISNKDAEISKLTLQIDKLEKERRMIKAELRNSQLGHQHTRSELQEKKLENDRFSKSLQEDETKLSHQKRNLDKVIQEKNSISAQMTKRNDEYNQLKNQFSNLQAAYDQTEKQYGQCQDDMRIMRIEIQNLRTERNVLRKDRESAADLRKELLQMHRILNQERIKARALQDEMLTPMNIHRWRNLRGHDPEKMDLIQKIQALRRQILAQNVTVLEQERALEETQLLYKALKEFMLKLPSYKIQEELNATKHKLFTKNRKLKTLMAELNIKESDDKTKQATLEGLKSNLTKTRIELIAERKKKQKLLEERQLITDMQIHCFSAPPTLQRTLGAGFKIIN